jgi:hypothetical protein
MAATMKRTETAAGAIISMSYILVCMMPLSNILLYPVPFWQYALTGAVLYAVLKGLTETKPGRITGLVVGIPAVLVFLFLLLDKGNAHKEFAVWMGKLGLAYEKLYFFEPLGGTKYDAFRLPILIMLTAATTLAVWLFRDRRFNFLALTGYGMTCFILSFEMAASPSKYPFVLFCILSMMSYAGSIYDRRRRAGVENRGTGVGGIMLASVPIMLVTLLIAVLLPKQDQPITWKWLDTQLSSAYSRIEQKFTNTDTEFFSLSATGFSGRAHLLGGRVRQSNTFVMEVKADSRAYLRGAAYANYTGSAWMLVDPAFDYGVEGQPESSVDLDEMGSLFGYMPPDLYLSPAADDEQSELVGKLADGTLADLLFPVLPMEITYRNMTTRTVMSPLKTMLPLKNADGAVFPVMENSRGILLATAFLGSGSNYSLSYRQPMYGDAILRKLLPLSRMGMYDDALRAYLASWDGITETVLEGKPDLALMNSVVAPNLLDRDGNRLPSPDLKAMISFVRGNPDPTLTPTYAKLAAWAQRSSEFHRKYTTLPETITTRTREFANTVTSGLTDDYDKAIAIRDALRETYPYTMITPRLPEGKDFVDWFLFDQKSGYCTSYATSMAVLLRTLNIPSRYVEGYVLPNKEEKEETYKVTNRYAHAWVEAYFEGFGWISFEPTPGFAEATDFLAQSTVDLSGYTGGNAPTDLEDLMRRYGDNRGIDGLDAGGFVTGPVKKPIPPLTMALMIGGGILLLLILLNAGSVLSESVRMRRTPDRRKIVLRFLRMMDWLKLAGMMLQEGESLPEFSSRVDNEYYFPETSFHILSDVFSRVRYGAKEPSLMETRMMVRMSHELHSQVVREIGIRRFMPLRHLFLGL